MVVADGDRFVSLTVDEAEMFVHGTGESRGHHHDEIHPQDPKPSRASTAFL
jgi:hypothetical protein